MPATYPEETETPASSATEVPAAWTDAHRQQLWRERMVVGVVLTGFVGMLALIVGVAALVSGGGGSATARPASTRPSPSPSRRPPQLITGRG